MSNSKMSISSTSSTKKYKQKHYDCVDDIMDFDYDGRQIFRVTNKRVISNIKARLKKSIDEVAKHRKENFDVEHDGDLLVSTNHILFEMIKYWFNRFFNTHNDVPKMNRQIRELKAERDRLHTKIGRLTAELEMLKHDTTDEENDIMDEDDLLLLEKYKDVDVITPEPEEPINTTLIVDTKECLID